MYNHAPENYQCPFCNLADGKETSFNKRGDIVFEDNESLAFISPMWWPNNPGHVIVIPKEHVENIYDIPDDIFAHVHVVTKKIALALKHAYGCDGITIRQHNEPAGGQEVWHLHVHVYPRYEHDHFYKSLPEKEFLTAQQQKSFADKLRAYFEKES